MSCFKRKLAGFRPILYVLEITNNQTLMTTLCKLVEHHDLEKHQKGFPLLTNPKLCELSATWHSPC